MQISQPRLAIPVSTAYNKDIIPDLTTQKPPPRTVPYQPPSFNLDRPTKCLTKEERLVVHHNYISAVSNLEHKKDLISRLKQSEPHNILTYGAEMTHHMALHNDVLKRIHTILKQDDYFRTLEELPMIDGLHAYYDNQLFAELFDAPAVIERTEAVCTHSHKLLCHVLQVLFNILTYYTCCTITYNRNSQATSDTTEPGNFPRQFTTMWTGNTLCYIRITATSTTRW